MTELKTQHSKGKRGFAVGSVLKAQREYKQFGLRQLAELAGVSAATISRLERGYESHFSVVDAVRKALNLSWDEVTGESCRHEFVCAKCGIAYEEVAD